MLSDLQSSSNSLKSFLGHVNLMKPQILFENIPLTSRDGKVTLTDNFMEKSAYTQEFQLV